MATKYKIFDYIWHVPHQYDLINALNEYCDFYHCLNVKKQWDYTQRPKPSTLKFVTHYERGKYDLAILHIDQQCIDNNSIKRIIYEQFNNIIDDIPKIVINHGSPVFPEWFHQKRLSYLEKQEMERRCIDAIKMLVRTNTMVVNSYTAASENEWGFGIPIVHGISPAEYIDNIKEPRVFTALSPHGFDSYYNRQCLSDIKNILYNEHGYTLAHARVNVNTHYTPDAFKNYLGRSLLYLDTSIRTPMNRARTEAFLSGCCVMQVEGAHDIERWGRNGENIILLPNEPRNIAAKIADFLENRYEEAINIGKEGKKMATSEFSPGKYSLRWMQVIEQVLSTSRTK